MSGEPTAAIIDLDSIRGRAKTVLGYVEAGSNMAKLANDVLDLLYVIDLAATPGKWDDFLAVTGVDNGR